jgi:transposase
MQVGWDWASETHDVTVMDTAGQVVDRWSLTHDEAGLDRAIGRLARHGHPRSAAGCDRDHQRRGRGPAVGRRSPGDTGAPQCVQCHPGTVGAARAKSDPGDSWKLADLLRTDGHRLHRLRPLDAAIRHLQVLARLRDDHLEAKTAATNQLGALLDAHWPGTKAIFARLDSPIALAFLERYPTPQAAQRLGQGRLATFCRRHAYSGHRTPAELLTRLRSAPVAVNSLDPKVLAACVAAQVQLLRALLAAIADLDRMLRTALRAHPKTAVLAAMPRIGQVNLAQILAEVGPILDRARDPEHAAAEAGAARSPNSRARPPRSTSAGHPRPQRPGHLR